MQVATLRETRSRGMLVNMKNTLLIMSLFCAGCDLFTNLEDITYQTLAVVDSGQDLSDDFSSEPDASDMAVDAPVDVSPDMPVLGTVCTQGGIPSGGCDILDPACEQGLVCTFIFNNGALQPGCVDASRYVLEDGADCSNPAAGSCAEGLICDGGTCHRACDRDTAAGCLADEFCKVWEPTSVYGYCSDACE